jgi:hypothetical protein
VACAELAGEVMAATVRTTEQLRRLRDELIDRLLRAADEGAARELARSERIPHDALVQVQAPARRGGWTVPGDMSAHVVTARARAATSGAPLPLVELGEAVRRAVCTRRAVAAGARPDPPCWDGLGGWRLVVEAPASLTPASIHPGAGILAGQPRPDLLGTARVVLDNGGDVTAAARILHLLGRRSTTASTGSRRSPVWTCGPARPGRICSWPCGWRRTGTPRAERRPVPVSTGVEIRGGSSTSPPMCAPRGAT